MAVLHGFWVRLRAAWHGGQGRVVACRYRAWWKFTGQPDEIESVDRRWASHLVTGGDRLRIGACFGLQSRFIEA